MREISSGMVILSISFQMVILSKNLACTFLMHTAKKIQAKIFALLVLASDEGQNKKN